MKPEWKLRQEKAPEPYQANMAHNEQTKPFIVTLHGEDICPIAVAQHRRQKHQTVRRLHLNGPALCQAKPQGCLIHAACKSYTIIYTGHSSAHSRFCRMYAACQDLLKSSNFGNAGQIKERSTIMHCKAQRGPSVPGYNRWLPMVSSGQNGPCYHTRLSNSL